MTSQILEQRIRDLRTLERLMLRAEGELLTAMRQEMHAAIQSLPHINVSVVSCRRNGVGYHAGIIWNPTTEYTKQLPARQIADIIAEVIKIETDSALCVVQSVSHTSFADSWRVDLLLNFIVP